MVLTFRFFEIFLEDKKGIGDVASLRLSLHGVILSPGGPSSPKFSRVPLVDVFVTEQLKVFCCRHTRRQAVSQDDQRTCYDADDDADADADDASVARSGDVATT